MSNFVQLCLQGNCLPEEIDDFVDNWHESTSPLPLHKFLGMTKAEYNLWVADPDILPFVLEAHKTGVDVTNLIEEYNALPMAARAGSSRKAQELAQWLKNQNLWD